MPDRVYLDWNATTPLRPEAREAMAAAWDLSGNPSSVHAEGRQARGLVEEARAAIAGAVGALPRNVVFTSGGTEANALALTPGLRRASGLSGQAVAGLGHRACLGARGRPVCGRGDRHHRRDPRRPAGSGPSARDARRRAAGAGVGDAGQQRNRRAAAGGGRRPRSSMPPADCCMSMRSRRSEKYRLISMR